jgi:hypothetical protein
MLFLFTVLTSAFILGGLIAFIVFWFKYIEETKKEISECKKNISMLQDKVSERTKLPVMSIPTNTQDITFPQPPPVDWRNTSTGYDSVILGSGYKRSNI